MLNKRTRFELLFSISLLFIFSAGAVFAPDMAELEIDHALTFDFSTPHTKWAKPYALGKTRVLFFVKGRGTDPRECVELMQRFDIEAKAIFWAPVRKSKGKSSWHGGKLGEQRMQNLLDRKWDCFVFLGLPMSNVPPKQKRKIQKAVMDGAGIIFVGSEGIPLLQPNSRLDKLPRFLVSIYSAEAYTIGEGRGIRLPDIPQIEFYEGWENEYDYWQEFVGRALLWASGKEPAARLQISISTVDPSGTLSVLKSATDSIGKKLKLMLSGEMKGSNPMVYVSIRSPLDKPLSGHAEKIDTAMPIEIPLAYMPAGSYHADAIVISSEGIETWATMIFEVTSIRKVKEIKLAKNWGEVGDSITGEVLLDGDALPDEILRIQVIDRRRRELLRKDIEVSGSNMAFHFEIKKWLPMLLNVEAAILSEGKKVSSASQYFRVTKRNRGKFNFLVWGVPRGSLAPYAEESLAINGVTLNLDRGNPPLYVSAFDISWVPYTTRILNVKNSNGIMQPFCWNNENAVKGHVAELAAKLAGSREHGTFVYSLGDENKTQGSCLSRHCAVAYRNYLMEVYHTLGALNRSWGTDFTNWENVGLSKDSDDTEENSLKQKNYPRWFDRQAFRSWNYVQYCQKYREAYRQLDPLAKVGFEGAGKFANGDDLDLLVRNLDFWSPYRGTVNDVIRSIASKGFIHSNWMGYRKDADSLLCMYWRMVTLGMDSVWWWRWDYIGRYHGFLAPDLRPYPEVKELMEDTKIVRDGLGDLLLESKIEDDGIAILYSYPSTFAHKLEEGASFGTYEEEHLAAIKLLTSRGLQFRYVTDHMLRLGEFDTSRYKVLLLPRAEAIGDLEASIIRKFVEEGGIVIADYRPGLYDNHCKPRSKGVLDDLFGISRVTRSSAQIKKLVYDHMAKIDPGVKANDAVTFINIGKIPVLFERKIAKGNAILLNFDFSTLKFLLNSHPMKGDKHICKAGILQSVFANLAPRITLEDDEGKHPDDIRMTRWKNGDVEIVSLVRETGIQEKLTVVLPKAKYIYDLRNHEFLNLRERFTTTIIPSRASFFVLCPISQPSLKFETDKAIVKTGIVAKGLLSVPGSKWLNAFRIQVHYGNYNLEWFNQILIVGAEPMEFDIPIAFNDPVGEYKISVTDLFTDQATSVSIKVQSVV